MCKLKKNGHKKERKTFSTGLSFNDATGANLKFSKLSIINDKKPGVKIQPIKRI